MVEMNKHKRNCPHCNSSKMRYHGFTVNEMHYYYECLNCHKFTEYHITSKKLKLLALFTLIFYVIVVLSLDTTPLIALFLLLGIPLVFVLSYKYRWLTETIPLERLPADRLIAPSFSNKIRFVIILFFCAAFLSYIGLIVYNRIGH
jgi:hypothetical protein